MELDICLPFELKLALEYRLFKLLPSFKHILTPKMIFLRDQQKKKILYGKNGITLIEVPSWWDYECIVRQLQSILQTWNNPKED